MVRVVFSGAVSRIDDRGIECCNVKSTAVLSLAT
jgi:hypothetical protein